MANDEVKKTIRKKLLDRITEIEKGQHPVSMALAEVVKQSIRTVESRSDDDIDRLDASLFILHEIIAASTKDPV